MGTPAEFLSPRKVFQHIPIGIKIGIRNEARNDPNQQI